MMKLLTSNNIKVGVFVALGLVVVLGTILLIGGDKSPLKNYYSLAMEVEEVPGLSYGSVVTLSGLPVGNVTKIELSNLSNSLQVVMDIDQKYQHRITTNSVASVRTQGALGDKYVFISPGPASPDHLKENEVITFNKDGDIFSRLANKGPELENLVDIVVEVRELLRRINAENRSTLLMKNLVASSASLDKVLKQALATLQDVRGAQQGQDNLKNTIARLAKVVKKLDEGQGTLGALINDPTLHDKLISLLGDSPRTKYMKPLLRESIKVRGENP